VGGNKAIADPGQLGHVLAQFPGPQGAVEAEGEGLDVAQGIPEGFRRLAGQGAPGGVRDGAGNHHRQTLTQLVEKALDGEQGRLGVQGGEHGFHQKQVRPPVHQALDGFGVIGYQGVKAHIAVAGVIHVRGNGGGAAGGAQHPGDEAGLGRIGGSELVADFPGQPGSLEIQLIDQFGEVVIRLGHRRGVEGVGLDNVRTRLQIGGVDAPDNLGLGEEQQIVVALQIVGVVPEALAPVIGLAQAMTLDHGAHGPVQDEDALFQESGDFGAAIGLHGVLGGSAGGRPKRRTAPQTGLGFVSAVVRCRAWPRYSLGRNAPRQGANFTGCGPFCQGTPSQRRSNKPDA